MKRESSAGEAQRNRIAIFVTKTELRSRAATGLRGTGFSPTFVNLLIPGGKFAHGGTGVRVGRLQGGHLAACPQTALPSPAVPIPETAVLALALTQPRFKGQ